MTDRYAVVWTRTLGEPVKMGNLIATDRECRFSYTTEYLAIPEAPGFALLAPPGLYGNRPVVHRSTERVPLHPRLMAMIPGNVPTNLQRKVYGALLAKRNPPPAPGFETEWAMLLLAGHGGIGHLDIFADDRAAEAWYRQSTEVEPVVNVNRSRFWSYVRDELEQTADPDETDYIAEVLGPTPSAGGMIPKILASIPDSNDWDGSFAPVGSTTLGSAAAVDVLIKIEPVGYEGLIALEAMTLELHRELGFAEVPRYWVTERSGMRIIAIERFDRTPDRRPVPMESFLSVLASGNREIQGSGDAEFRQVARMIDKLPQLTTIDPKRVKQQVFERFVVAFLTGNGDLHLENLSFLQQRGETVLAPPYDTSPMRAWSRHNLRSAIPIDIEPEIGGFIGNLFVLGTEFGRSARQVRELFASYLEKLAVYPERVMELETIPVARREYLIKVVQKEHGLVREVLDMYK